MTVPLIDVAGLRTGREDDAAAVADAIVAATRSAGFFSVVNHGVADETVQRALVSAKQFFSLAEEDKRAVGVDERHRGYLGFGAAVMDGAPAPDLKESFVYGVDRPVPDDEREATLIGPNRWPAGVPGLRDAAYAFFLALIDAGRVLLGGVALALGLPQSYFDGPLADPLARGSLIHYPPRPAGPVPGQRGVDAHTDFGLITLLWQDQVGGLEVEVGGRGWVAVDPVPGALVVNIGDLLARWSNGRLPSTTHRVTNDPSADRYSMAVFLDPSYGTVVDPGDMVRPGDRVDFSPVVAGEHVAGRLGSAFAYRQAVRP